MELKVYKKPYIAIIQSPELMQTTLPIASPNQGAGTNPGEAEGKSTMDIVDDEEDDEEYSIAHYPLHADRVWGI